MSDYMLDPPDLEDDDSPEDDTDDFDSSDALEPEGDWDSDEHDHIVSRKYGY